MQNNPITRIDPDGNFDVFINGDQADKAFTELQKSTSLTLSRDSKTGQVSATGTANTDADKALLAATTDSSIKVELHATTSKKTSDGKAALADGAFMGNSTDMKTNVVTANQEVNPVATEQIDNYYKKPGASVMHEVIEGYVGAQMTQISGVNSVPNGYSTQNGLTPSIANYSEVHEAASKIAPQSGPTYEARQGNTVYYFVGDGKSPSTTLIYNQRPIK